MVVNHNVSSAVRTITGSLTGRLRPAGLAEHVLNHTVVIYSTAADLSYLMSLRVL